ncbi:MAG: NAD(P)/FAD-dependent oxidoreductase [Desulfobacterales bacterium]|nr:NAD(P)/FAD-dependent oxidoreductase [Desulfobacterales bacterium]
MKKYDDLVVGSGISGMTLALLLGMNGRSVLLLEKSPRIGGSLARFYREGIPFDTGFHFTGGFGKNGILHDMLTVLGIHDYVKPIYLSKEKNNRIIFEAEQATYDMPTGYQETIAKLKEYFPGEEQAIDWYFEMVKDVCSRTVAMDLRKISLSPNLIDEDFVSLDDVLKGLTDNCTLRAFLAAYSMCYGVKPAEVSFANHSRVCFGLYQSVARVKDGGDAFIKAFRECFAELDIAIMCDRYITGCVDIRNKHVGRFVLNTGEEISCTHCIFTIHPKEILKTLPQEHLSNAFVDRVNAFEPSAGFFSVFGVVEPDDPADDFDPSILSLFPTTDVNSMLDPGTTSAQALVIMKNREVVGGRSYRVMNASEISFPEHVAAWKDSRTGNRPPGYAEYKQKRVDSIRRRIVRTYPEYRDSFRVVEAASVLTFRDYLHSPDGSAYGVKQKIGQFNLFGKLPLRNVYAAGQSSMLPGVVGAMMSSFIVGRSIVGKEKYCRFIEQRLCS